MFSMRTFSEGSLADSLAGNDLGFALGKFSIQSHIECYALCKCKI